METEKKDTKESVLSKYNLYLVGEKYVLFTDDRKTFYVSSKDYKSLTNRITVLKTYFPFVLTPDFPLQSKEEFLNDLLGLPATFLKKINLQNFNPDILNLFIKEDKDLIYDEKRLFDEVFEDKKLAKNSYISNILMEHGIFISDIESVLMTDTYEKPAIILQEFIDKKYLDILNDIDYQYFHFYSENIPFHIETYKNIISKLKNIDINQKLIWISNNSEELTGETDSMIIYTLKSIYYDILKNEDPSITIGDDNFTAVSNVKNLSSIPCTGLFLDLFKIGRNFDMYGIDKYYDLKDDRYILNYNKTSFYFSIKDKESIKQTYEYVHKIYEHGEFDYISINYIKMMGLPYEAYKVAKYFDFENGTSEDFISLFDFINIEYRNYNNFSLPYFSDDGYDVDNSDPYLYNAIEKFRYLLRNNNLFITSVENIISSLPKGFFLMFDYDSLPKFLKPYIDGEYKLFLNVNVSNKVNEFINSLTAMNEIAKLNSKNDIDVIDFFKKDNAGNMNDFMQLHVEGNINLKVKEFFSYLKEGDSTILAFNKLNVDNEIGYRKFITCVFTAFYKAISDNLHIEKNIYNDNLFINDINVHIDDYIFHLGRNFYVAEYKNEIYIPIVPLKASTTLLKRLTYKNSKYYGFFLNHQFIRLDIPPYEILNDAKTNFIIGAPKDFSSKLYDEFKSPDRVSLETYIKKIDDKTLIDYESILYTYAGGIFPLIPSKRSYILKTNTDIISTLLTIDYDVYNKLLQYEQAMKVAKLKYSDEYYSDVVYLANDGKLEYELNSRLINGYKQYYLNIDTGFSPIVEIKKDANNKFVLMRGRLFNLYYDDQKNYYLDKKDKIDLEFIYSILLDKMKKNNTDFDPFLLFYLMGLPLQAFESFFYTQFLSNTSNKSATQLPKADLKSFLSQYKFVDTKAFMGNNYDEKGSYRYLKKDRDDLVDIYETKKVARHLLDNGIFYLGHSNVKFSEYLRPEFILKETLYDVLYFFNIQLIDIDIKNPAILDYFKLSPSTSLFLVDNFVSTIDPDKNNTLLDNYLQELINYISFYHNDFLYIAIESLTNNSLNDFVKSFTTILKTLSEKQVKRFSEPTFILYLLKFIHHLVAKYIITTTKRFLKNT